jgi:hypothetical protein
METRRHRGASVRRLVGRGAVATFSLLLLAGAAAPTPVATGADGSTSSRNWPFQRIGASTVLDPATNALVLFGGWNGERLFNDVWFMDTSAGEETWLRVRPEGAPPPARAYHSAIIDTANHRLVIYGGRTRLAPRADVWALDLDDEPLTWRELLPAGSAPPARQMHTAIYDVYNHRMVVFGGQGSNGLLGDLWSLGLTEGTVIWSEIAATGPSPVARAQQSAVYAGTQMVVFGGAGARGLLGDTWSLHLGSGLEAWRQIVPGQATPAPSARRGHLAIHVPLPAPFVLLFGGLTGDGFKDDVWRLDLTAGAEAWGRLEPGGTGPTPRAWGCMGLDDQGTRAIVFGGVGRTRAGTSDLDGFAAPAQTTTPTHWALTLSEMPRWASFMPRLAGHSVQASARGPLAVPAQSASHLTIAERVEDADPHQVVSVLGGVGADGYTQLYIGHKVTTGLAGESQDLVLTLTVEDDVLGNRVDVGFRATTDDEPTGWTAATSLGGGQYRLTGLDLDRLSDGTYKRLVVFRFKVPSTLPAREVALSAEVCAGTVCDDDEGTISAVTDTTALLLTNRRLLFDMAGDADIVLDRLFTMATGLNYSNPVGVVLYTDRYVTAAQTWDNTQVNYASESTANSVASAIDQWLDPLTRRITPVYVVIVGDDNIIPFYRQHDYPDADYYQLPDTEDGVPTTYGRDPVMDAVVSHSYFLTDNPYADYSTTPDWEQGELDFTVARIVGATMDDMDDFIAHGVRSPNPDGDQFVTASAEFGDLVQDGSNNDVVDIARSLNYDRTSGLVTTDPDKTEIVDAMRDDMVAMAFAGHGETTEIVAPGGSGTWSNDRISASEMAQYDTGGALAEYRPFYYFNACRVGMAYNTQGATGSLVYALAHRGASGIVASAGLAHAPTPLDMFGPSETLNFEFWDAAYHNTTDSIRLGKALTNAKKAYALMSTWYAEDKKTVQAFTYFGVPWTRFKRRVTSSPDQVAATGSAVPPSPAPVRGAAAWSAPLRTAQVGTFVITATVDASTYAVTQTHGFDLVQVAGMRQQAGKGEPVLPLGTVDFLLPVTATLVGTVVTPTQPVQVPDLNLPSVVLHSAHPSAPPAQLIATPDGTYPAEHHATTTDILDTMQRVRVAVRPLVYDATANEGTLFRRLQVAITYTSPVPIAITHFETDQDRYAPGEAVRVSATVANVIPRSLPATAILVIQDRHGQVAGTQRLAPFELPPGQGYPLTLEWTGALDDDAYVARLLVVAETPRGDRVRAVAGDIIHIARGEIAWVTGPEGATAGGTAPIEVAFTNFTERAGPAVVALAVRDGEGTTVATFDPQVIDVPSGKTTAVVFDWQVPAGMSGDLKAVATVTFAGQPYGPEGARFTVTAAPVPPSHAVYLPRMYRKVR